MIIGLNGFAGSGKDEAAKALVAAGFTRIAFADVLRDMAYAMDPYVLETIESDGDMFIFRRLSKVVDNYGWDFAKNNFPDVRRTLQRLGTDAGRDILGENIWINTAFNRANAADIVVTDVRFPNEAESIQARGGKVVRIERPGLARVNDHPSETSLLDYPFDVTIVNDGTIDDLYNKVQAQLLSNS